jgi:hypothetical protein
MIDDATDYNNLPLQIGTPSPVLNMTASRSTELPSTLSHRSCKDGCCIVEEVRIAVIRTQNCLHLGAYMNKLIRKQVMLTTSVAIVRARKTRQKSERRKEAQLNWLFFPIHLFSALHLSQNTSWRWLPSSQIL